MKYNKAVGWFSVLLICIFIFQLMTLLTFGEWGFFTDAGKADTFLSAKHIHNDAVILNQDNRKPLSKVLITKLQGIQPYRDNGCCSCAEYLNYHQNPIDFRQKIKYVMSNYFHGSKFKNAHRCI